MSWILHLWPFVLLGLFISLPVLSNSIWLCHMKLCGVLSYTRKYPKYLGHSSTPIATSHGITGVLHDNNDDDNVNDNDNDDKTMMVVVTQQGWQWQCKDNVGGYVKMMTMARGQWWWQQDNDDFGSGGGAMSMTVAAQRQQQWRHKESNGRGSKTTTMRRWWWWQQHKDNDSGGAKTRQRWAPHLAA